MYMTTLFPRDVFRELDRLQQDVQQALGLTPSIRGAAQHAFPALNVGTTPQSVELYAFAPGLEPSSIDVQVDRGVLTIGAERKPSLPSDEAGKTVHIHERFAGRFRRVVSLPEDADPQRIEANYREGVLHISVKRQEAAQPRRVEVH
jgi:HSP20 family protein